MTELNDDELRSRFDDLRDDETTVPSFQVQWARAEAGARITFTSRRRAPVWVAAAAVIVLVGGVMVRRAGDGAPSRAFIASPISKWRSPTVGLLNISGRELIAPASILSSKLDGAIRAPIRIKGASR